MGSSNFHRLLVEHHAMVSSATHSPRHTDSDSELSKPDLAFGQLEAPPGKFKFGDTSILTKDSKDELPNRQIRLGRSGITLRHGASESARGSEPEHDASGIRRESLRPERTKFEGILRDPTTLFTSRT